MAITYRTAKIEDIEILTDLTVSLYDSLPDSEFPNYDYDPYTREELFKENNEHLQNPEMTFFIAFDNDKAIGLAHTAVKHEYVMGTNNTPVGYLEGIYVCPDYRRQGIAQSLVSMCENWSREKGCVEFASDCEQKNKDSFAFHLKIGFKETERLIFFSKML
jgi:aminoglycoside 6'-N-acetyltransferase I